MKAVWYDRTGPAREVLVGGERPKPAPGRGEVLIRVRASGVNPSDVGMRGGASGAPMAYPRITPNSDGAGVVEAYVRKNRSVFFFFGACTNSTKIDKIMQDFLLK